MSAQIIRGFHFDFALPQADHITSNLFSKPVLKATSFIEKCLFHFHTDLPRGGSDICRKQSQTMYSLMLLSPVPSMTLSGRDLDPPMHDPAETHELMSPFDQWLQINFTVS